MRRRAQGFTLIELIIVITILGILAAVALPRFISAQQDARIAKARALFGSIRSAAALAKARCELDLAGAPGATCTATAGTANMDGANVAMAYRYPAATDTGIQRAAQIVPDADGVTVTAGNPIAFSIVGATDPATCVIKYTAGTATDPAVVTVDTSGC